ncbi:MAG: 3-deoxy-D-manno-octulosonic acid transferase [Proteobacteria bacterium]|nr:3-deoxy-D-manno-octulosonic acid transferase [Pseudomonadota bacterium]
MTFPVYTVAYAGGVLLAAPFLFFKGRKGRDYLNGLSSRMGRLPPALPGKTRPRVWVHGLSLGEVNASLPLVRRIEEAGCEVCFSATTQSGLRLAEERLGPATLRCPFPLDWPPAIRRILAAVRPDLFVLMETDIWPNVLDGLSRRGVPALLVNARVSPRSYRGYRLLRPLWRRALARFTAMSCQTELDRRRLLDLGADPEKVGVAGNLKYDRPEPETGAGVRAALLAETGLPGGRWLVCGSTHPGEDEILLDVFQRLGTRFPDLRLVLAPRNRSRFEAVWDLVRSRNLPAARRTGTAPGSDTMVYLLDTLGELDRFYELSELVFIGKSLPVPGEGGGHNLLEPAARAKPLLFGPRMHNFPEIARLVAASGGGRRVADAAALEAAAAELLDNPDLARDMGQKARLCLDSHRGALNRTMELILRTLAQGSSRA